MIHFFTWVFNNLFLAVISTALALRFKQVRKRLEKFGKKTHSLTFWYQIRKDYIRLCRLCKVINEYMSFQISVAFTFGFLFVLSDFFRIVR